jgi:hypothetical protein
MGHHGGHGGGHHGGGGWRGGIPVQYNTYWDTGYPEFELISYDDGSGAAQDSSKCPVPTAQPVGDLSTTIGQMGIAGYLLLGVAAYALYKIFKGKK